MLPAYVIFYLVVCSAVSTPTSQMEGKHNHGMLEIPFAYAFAHAHFMLEEMLAAQINHNSTYCYSSWCFAGST